MTGVINTRAFPGGTDTDVLVVCYNDQHIKYVYQAFGMKAHYITWGSTPTGRRYKKIIVFRHPERDYGTLKDRQYLNEGLFPLLKQINEGLVVI